MKDYTREILYGGDKTSFDLAGDLTAVPSKQ